MWWEHRWHACDLTPHSSLAGGDSEMKIAGNAGAAAGAANSGGGLVGEERGGDGDEGAWTTAGSRGKSRDIAQWWIVIFNFLFALLICSGIRLDITCYVCAIAAMLLMALIAEAGRSE